MHYRIMLSFYGLILALMAFTTQANAVSLGKIDVASHLGEPFYAEVPLALDEGEVVSSVFVELAAPADYRILEVYRDQGLNEIRADVESDSRGQRIELTSRTALDAPFFNVILKVRYGRATHYKKYPVFLDLPRAAQPAKHAAPLPSVSVGDAEQEVAVPTVSPVKGLTSVTQSDVRADGAAAVGASPFVPFDGWARTNHYGPMVYGDTLSTVADRLRVDSRYSRNQVMVAIFEKNRSKFSQDNVNLIQAGTHLDVPMADEVERIRPDQANAVIEEHTQRWQELMQQPRYAAVAEAQKNRYSKRVRVGKAASGAAVAPVSTGDDSTMDNNSGANSGGESSSSSTPSSEGGAVNGSESGQATPETAVLTEAVTKLQQENEALQNKLAAADAKLAEAAAAAQPDVQVAAEARVKKLELQLARLQAELDSAKQGSDAEAGIDWLTILGGGLVLLLLGGGAGYLMRREPQHPAMEHASRVYPDHAESSVPAAAPQLSDQALEEIEVEPIEEFSPDATTRMNTDEFEHAFTDSIPDLTDEETGEMEAFKEDLEEEPDPNVDYLSEADVYMRYGMEDEAQKQVEMALKLKESNPEAHAKMVQIKKAKGDDAGADAAIATARMVLGGDTLTQFESTIASLTTGGSRAEESSLQDTLPPGALDVSGDPQVEKGLDDSSSLSELDDIEFDSEEAVPEAGDGLQPNKAQPSKAESSAAETESLDLGDLEWAPEEASDEAAIKTQQQTVKSEPAESEGGLDFDLSGLDLGDEGEKDTASPTPEAAAPKVEKKVEAPASARVESNDLDLSDMDFESSDVADAAQSPAVSAPQSSDEVMTADLDKTVVMDWSKDTVTSGNHELGGESGAGDLEIDFGADEASSDEATDKAPVAEAEVEATPELAPAEEEITASSEVEVEAEEESEPAEHLTSVEFDLEDLNVDLDEKVDSDDVDDFSSTIQTSIDEIKKSGGSSAAVDSDAFDFDLPDEEASDNSASISPAGLGEDVRSSNASLEELIEKSEDKDFDATLELDSLLNELGGMDDKADPKEGKDKK